MRAYFFTNMYLSSIQQGIQPLHVTADMFIKYMKQMCAGTAGADVKLDTLKDWAENHKTVICLNGGYSATLHDLIVAHMTSKNNPYPWESFKEGDDALDGALTSVGIILPERVYEGASQWRADSAGNIEHGLKSQRQIVQLDGTIWKYTDWEVDFMKELNNYGLAK